MGEMGALSLTPDTESPAPAAEWRGPAHFSGWRSSVRRGVLAHLADFVGPRRSELDDTRIDAAGDILMAFVSGGKCLRSTFMYLGWLCGAAPDRGGVAGGGQF